MTFQAEITKGSLQLVILTLLSEKPMYGYQIVKTVNERTCGALQWREAALYPMLRRMEERELVEGRWREGPKGKRRRYYSITRKGSAVCAQWRNEWERFSSAVSGLVLRA